MKILTWLTNLAGLSNLSLGSRNLLWLIGNRPGTSELITRTLKHHIGTLETTSRRRSESHLDAWNRIHTLGIASRRSESHLDARIASRRSESHLDARNRIWMLESHLDARNRIWTLGITPRRSESCVELFKHHQHLLITVEGLPSSSIAPHHRQKLLGIVGNCSASSETTYHRQKPPASLQDYLLVIGTTS
ncbi:hypothetical protein PSTG_11873 [Puccinia striiformis f. sp. tritici PST-78]|uniref:Uncharacterized protein n=1 Tax=Puccinia striiformis f. sp. tritici PST-78 TaxID=1165861 RepID=A0A0L0V6F8_9BASI|nr:hypothetical protein PSTG_11873 [Puccinia striiformis f. sp. tritici PST-78]